MTKNPTPVQKAVKDGDVSLHMVGSAAEPGTAATFLRALAQQQARLRSEALKAQSRAQEARQAGQATSREQKAPPEAEDARLPSAGQPGAPAPTADGARQEQSVAALAEAAGPTTFVPQAAAGGEAPDLLALASLLPAGDNDGVFEVTMQDNEKIGVSVDRLRDTVSYLLVPDSEKMANRLHGHEMELEAWLRRRISRNVRVTVI